MRETYFLVPKELMDKLMSDLGSFTYLTNSYDELKPISDALTNCKEIDLSDEAIAKRAEVYIDTIKDGFNSDFRGYNKALKYLKETLNETK